MAECLTIDQNDKLQAFLPWHTFVFSTVFFCQLQATEILWDMCYIWFKGIYLSLYHTGLHNAMRVCNHFLAYKHGSYIQ